MPLPLVLPAYVGLIPALLLTGIVVAVKRRSSLGGRASSLLIVGAGLLLLGELLSWLRPLLRDVIAQPAGAPFPGAADLVTALSC